MPKLPYVIAHRGLSAAYPENTLSAFQAAVNLKVDWIELDVVMTGDGVVIVSHDETADRCTNGSGPFRAQLWNDIKQLDAGSWFGAAFAGERIPTLDEVLDLVRLTTTRLCIEIKGETPEEFLETAAATVSLLQTRQFLQNASIASFNGACLSAVRQLEPMLTTNFDPTPQDGSLSAWELCQQCLAVGANFLSHKYETLTPELIDEARSHGLPIWVWTVNDADSMRRMADLHVDAILSDDAEMLKRVIGS